MKKAICILPVVAIIAVLASCGLWEQPATGSITISISNLINAKVLMPDVSLTAAEFDVHGDGVSGTALGASFDITLSAGSPTANVDLLPGGWEIQATAMNDDIPSVAIGISPVESITVQIGVADGVTLDCMPFTGVGDYSALLEWIPDILANPGVEIDLVSFDSTVNAVPTTILTSVTAEGALSLEQGWYTQFIRITDSGELASGIVETCRIAYNALTLADYFLTVNQLEGAITIDATWYPGDPLVLTTNPAEGVVTVYGTQVLDIDITDADNDSGTTLVFAWYLNGEAVVLDSDGTFTVNGDDYEEGSQYYLSCIVWQSDGKRAGDAQFQIDKQATHSSQYDVEIIYGAPGTVGDNSYVRILADDFTTVIESWINNNTQVSGNTHSFTALSIGDIYIQVYEGGSWATARLRELWQEADTQGTATLVSIPHPYGENSYDMGDLSFSP